MSNYINIPISSDGVIVDDHIDELVNTAMSADFAFSDIYLYSHGWSLDATRMMDWYNRFSIEYNKNVIDLVAADKTCFVSPPSPQTLGIGIHWPSMISENENDMARYAQQLTFYTMDKRAGTVGMHGLYAVLRLILTSDEIARLPSVRLNLLGHSFGCKVVASALEEVYKDLADGTIPKRPNVSYNVVLLQGAFERRLLETGQCFGDVDLLNLRMLVTRSDLDEALQTWFDVAHLNIDFFLKQRDDSKRALGALGPTDATLETMNNQLGGTIEVGRGFDGSALRTDVRRLIVADLTPLHRATGAQGSAAFGGHHSDIFLPEIYSMIAGFLYNNNAFAPNPEGAG